MSDLKNKRSEIWKHFTIVSDGKAKCSYCNKMLNFVGGATGNFGRHVKSVPKAIPFKMVSYGHPEPDDKSLEEQQTTQKGPSTSQNLTVVPSVTNQQTILNFVRKLISLSGSKQLDEQLIRVIVKEYQPFRVVEDPEFKKFIYMLCPNYKMPDRKTISNSLIPRLYNSTKEVISNELSDVDAVCLTTDGWTSINNQSFMALTAHFIDGNQEKHHLKSYLLGCVPFYEQHTAKNLCEQLKSQVNEWGLANKIACIISDNATNITSAIKVTGWRFFPCFAHTLNLVLQAELFEIKEQVDKVKAIVQFFERSSSALAKLKDTQSQMGLPELKLKQDVVTRWNSTYDMLSRIIAIKKAVVSLLAVDEPHLNTLSPNDWIILEKSIEVLKLFSEITEEISAENSVTISKFENTLKAVRAKITTFSSTDAGHSSETIPSGSNPKNEAGCKEKSSIWDDFDHTVKNVLTSANPVAASIIEVDKYLTEPLIRRTEDPIHWWEERKQVYPRLYKLMRRRLCIVACERIFSKAGNLINEKRSRLKPEKASELLFLNHNL
ncbi:hypothetical protein ILUMI_27464 [Ignelater luminosus]|uniref:BED-type domain-containing protein n=1 Tax=Ignelater luminosus TaxID=2038154 RepID=A0A8K0FWX0_IGNLU|nr:hypothetical protein ILUMI_27464 [Ignelater luminosus]